MSRCKCAQGKPASMQENTSPAVRISFTQWHRKDTHRTAHTAQSSRTTCSGEFAALFISVQLAEGPAYRATRACARPCEPQGWETLAGPQKETRARPCVRASSRLRSNTSTDMHMNKQGRSNKCTYINPCKHLRHDIRLWLKGSDSSETAHRLQTLWVWRTCRYKKLCLTFVFIWSKIRNLNFALLLVCLVKEANASSFELTQYVFKWHEQKVCWMGISANFSKLG